MHFPHDYPIYHNGLGLKSTLHYCAVVAACLEFCFLAILPIFLSIMCFLSSCLSAGI